MSQRRGGVDPAVVDVLTRMWPAPSTVTFSRSARSRQGYVALPNRRRPTYLLPAGPAAVTAAALLGFRPAHTARARLRARVLAAAARCGAAALMPTVRIEERADNLVGHLAERLGQPLVAGISLGPPRANRKPVLQLCDPRGRTVAFAKIAVNGLTRERLRTEVAALEAITVAGLVDVVAPRVLAAAAWAGLDYLLLTPVQTWSKTGIDAGVRSRFLNALVGSTAITPAPLAAQVWWTATLDRLRSADNPEARELLHLAEQVEAGGGNRPLVVGGTHGDFTPHNFCTEAGVAFVWDWERYSAAMPAGFDALHYAFHQDASLDSRARLAALAGQVGAIVESNGAPAVDGDQLFGAYLVHIGDRFLVDRQAAAGERRGPLSKWLIPALAAHLNAR